MLFRVEPEVLIQSTGLRAALACWAGPPGSPCVYGTGFVVLALSRNVRGQLLTVLRGFDEVLNWGGGALMQYPSEEALAQGCPGMLESDH